MKIFAVCNHKGGVAKTTTAVNLAHATARLGFETLIIDMDPQANTTETLLPDYSPDDSNINDIFEDKKADLPILETGRENLSIVPSSIHLSNHERNASHTVTHRLKNKLSTLEGFDYVFIDTPGNLGIFTNSALIAATHYIIPIEPAKYALDGMQTLLEVCDDIKESINQNLEMGGVIVTRLKNRVSVHSAALEDIHAYFPNGNVLKPYIPENVSILEAEYTSGTIFEVDTKSTASKAYGDLAKELTKNGK